MTTLKAKVDEADEKGKALMVTFILRKIKINQQSLKIPVMLVLHKRNLLLEVQEKTPSKAFLEI